MWDCPSSQGMSRGTTSRKTYSPGRPAIPLARKSLSAASLKKDLVNRHSFYKYEIKGCCSECRSHEAPTFAGSPQVALSPEGGLRHLTLAANVLNLATGCPNVSHCYHFSAFPAPANPRGLEQQEAHSFVDSFFHGFLY